MSKEAKSKTVGRLWKAKEGDSKNLSGTVNVSAVSELEPDEYGNVRVVFMKNNFRRDGKNDAQYVLVHYFDSENSRPPSKKTYSKPPAKPAPKKVAPPVDEDEDFLD